MTPIHDVFISHAGEDKDFLAQPTYEGLNKLGMRSFLDREELHVGGPAQEEMIQSMETAPIGLFILSPEFPMKKWTMLELFCFHRRRAQAVAASGNQGASIIPVLIPVFYRLTVAESRYRQVFNKYAELASKLRFFDRADRAEANIKEVMDALAKLTDYTGVENVKGATNESSEEMKARREELVKRICEEVGLAMTRLFPVPCNVPEVNDEVTLDFEDAGSEREGRSFESKLLQEIIREDHGTERRIVVVKGGAGVGKSCALRGVGRRDEITFRFRGGVYYLSLGMDATVETLVAELLRTLRACGGGEAAEELRNETRLDIVVEKVGEAMKDKKSLLLIDDLWHRNGLGPGTVDQVRQALGKNSGGVIVVTTRDTAVASKGTVVEIAPRGVLSAEARRILLRHAKISVEEITEDFQGVFNELLRLCGGLPLCLAIMGRGLLKLFLNARCKDLEVWERYLRMMKEGEKLVFENLDDYQNLWTTLTVSLRVLEEHRGQYTGSRRGLSWSEMYRSFCTLKKQSIVRFRALARFWSLNSEAEAFYVVSAFSSMGLADIVMGGEASGVRLHDLLHDFSVACAKKEGEVTKWHELILEGYAKEEEGREGLREWWNVEDDGYIYGNVCWHLGSSGYTEELLELALSRMWTQTRLKHGGILALSTDFADSVKSIGESEKYEQDEKDELKRGLELVRDAVMESWTFLVDNRQELGFQVDARLFGCREEVVRKFLASVRDGEDRPYAKALGRLWGRPGRGGRGEFLLSDVVWAIALQDEAQLAVAGVGRDVVFIDLEGMKVRTCAGHAGNTKSVALSGDGSRAYSWTDDGTVREWHAETGEELSCVHFKNEGGGESVASAFWCAAISPERNFVVTGSRGMVEVWDMKTGERRGGAMGGFKRIRTIVRCVSVSHDGRRIVAGGSDGTLRVWDEPTRVQVGSVLRGHEDWVNCATFSADGRLVASGSSDYTIRIWDVGSGKQSGNAIHGHDDWVWCVCFSADGRRIVSGGGDGSVRIWDVVTGAQVGPFLRAHLGVIRGVSMSRDERSIVSCGDDHTVRAWDLTAAVDGAEERAEDEGLVECLTVSDDGRWFVSGSEDGTMRVYAGSSGKQDGAALHAHGRTVTCVAVSPCGQHIVSGSADETLCVWNIETRTRVGEPLHGHTDWVFCVAYSSNGQIIVSGSLDKTVRVWSTKTHKQIVAPIGRGTKVTVGRMPLLLKGVGRLLGYFDTRTEQSGDASVNVHTDWVTCVRVSTDGRRIICGLRTGRLYVWDISSGELVGAPPSEHNGRIVRLDLLAGNAVRSVDEYDFEMMWELDDEEGLVRLTFENDSAQGGAAGQLFERRSELNEIVCVGRQVRVRGSEAQLATLPVKKERGHWHYNGSSGVLGIVLEDGRLVFLQIEW